MKSIYLVILILIIGGTFLNAQDCPYREIDDPYPGKCARYWDSDGDGICDLSQEVKADTNDSENVHNETLIEEENPVEQDDEETTDSDQDEADNSVPDNSDNADEIASEGESEGEGSSKGHGYGKNRNKNSDSVNIDNADPFRNKSYQFENSRAVKRKPADRYGLAFIIPIWLLMIAATVLVKNQKLKIIRLCDVNTAWNWLVLFSFAVVSITSISLLLREYAFLKFSVSGWILWHNISGIIFILASVGHIYLKYQYYILVIQGRIRRVK